MSSCKTHGVGLGRHGRIDLIIGGNHQNSPVNPNDVYVIAI